MAYSYKTIYTVVSDGVTKVFTIPYGFLRASFIEVWINDTTKLTYLTDYTVNTAGEVELVSAVAAGSTIAIKRNTSKLPLVSWSDASVLLSKDLSLQDTQLLHIQEELSDAVQNDATEAAARATQAAADALAYKNAAKTSEDNAKLSETAADLSELNAKTSEDNAKASETAARASEVAAKASETAAANSAVGAAASQVASANSSLAASNSETNALASKVAAKTSEDNAKASETAAAGSASGAATSATTATEAAATAVANGGTLALPNHIVKGGKVASISGLTMTHGAIQSVIKRRLCQKSAGDVQTLPAKRLGLFTIDKDGNRGTVLAASPLSFVDNNTIGFWELDGSASIPNQAEGISSIAVANPLVKAGTLGDIIPGRYGKDTIKGGGSTGNGYATSNTTNFTSGASDFCWEFSYTAGANGTYQGICWMGYTGTTKYGFEVGVLASGNITVFDMSIVVDTGFSILEAGEYEFAVGIKDGAAVLVINGVQVYTGLSGTWNMTASNLWIMREINASYPGARGAIHYLEYRKKWRTTQELAEKAAKLLFPICWTTGDTDITNKAVASAPFGGVAGNAKDGDSNTYLQTNISTGGGFVALQYDFGLNAAPNKNVSLLLDKISWSGGTTNTANLEYSSDGENWGIYYTFVNLTGVSTSYGTAWASFPFYRYWRLRMTSFNANGTLILYGLNFKQLGTTRKNLTATLPNDGTISLGMFRTGTDSILGYDDYSWQWARREGASGGNRLIIGAYKAVVAQTSASMYYGNPFGMGSSFKTLSIEAAETSTGLNNLECSALFCDGACYGVCINSFKGGGVGLFVGSGGATKVNGTWRTGGYARPVFEILEPEEEVPDIAS